MESLDYCPHCGEPVPSGARACPACGSDEETGWSERARRERLGIPEEEFDYDEFVREEWGSPEDRIRPRGIGWLWWLVALGLLILFLRYWVL